MDSIERELRSLMGERKMNEVALKGYQWQIAEQLKGTMGQDMNDVLAGNKEIKLSLWRKIKHKFDMLLWNLGLVQ